MDEELQKHLRHQFFVSLATATRDGRPHTCPKLLLKFGDETVYLIDYLIAHSFDNIKSNPRVCITTFNVDEVLGYHLFGKAQIIEEGSEYKKLLAEWDEKQIKVAADQVVETVKGSTQMKSFKFTFLKPVVIYKIRVTSVDKIDSKGLIEE